MAKFIIEGGRPLSGSISPSGNKNEALPTLMACLLTDEPVTLRRVPRIKDVLTVCEILQDLGVTVEWQGEDVVSLDAKNVHSYQPDEKLCSHIRASVLLLGPLLSRFGKVKLPPPGGDVIGMRRIDTHFDGARALGASLEFGHPMVGSIEKIIGSEIYLDEPSVTGTGNILLLAVRCEGRTVIHNAACEPHIAGLCKLLNLMGAKISGIGSNRLEIEGVTSLKGADYTIGPDFMEVGSFLCLGAIAGGQVTIENTSMDDLRFVLKTLRRVGIAPVITGNSLTVNGNARLNIQKDLGDRVGTIYSGPWPAFPTDLMSVTIVAATQAYGTMIFFEKMFESRMFFTDKLMAMGANIVLCDPHRIVVNGPSPLFAAHLSSPDVRAGMAMLMAAVVAKGKSEIDNIYQIERGYHNIHRKLESLGAAIRRVEG
jgi:UDP-N-acetylglucosamine 1-carboxyvinyltransferase